MSISAIRVRYAKAFFTLAKEKNMLDQLKTDIQGIFDICNQSADFIHLIESPVVTTTKKSELISKIFKSQINNLTLNFLLLIISNKREIHIPGICRNFLDLTRKDQNIKSAVMITATKINSGTVEKIKTLIEKELATSIELTCNVQPEIVGGLILRIDDKQYDSSVNTQLKKIKQALLESEIKL
jgi:F-type H+-transporting ATPase subunit delta